MSSQSAAGAMNSKPNSSNHAQKAAAPLNNYDFDFGLGASFSKSNSRASLKSQKAPSPSSFTASWASQSSGTPSMANSPSPNSRSTPNNPTPAMPSQQKKANGFSGNISGKSWVNTDPSRLANTGIVGGLGGKAEADMFKDLLHVPLGRSSVQKKATFSMAPLASSLPKGAPLNQAKAVQSKLPREMGDMPHENAANLAPASDLFGSFEGNSCDATSKFAGSSLNQAKAAQSKLPSELGDSFAAAFDKPTENASNLAPSSDLFGSFEGTSCDATSKLADPFDFSDQIENPKVDTFGDFKTGSSTAPSESTDPFAASAHVPVDLFADSSFLGTPPVAPSDDPFSSVGNSGLPANTSKDPSEMDSFGAFSGIDPSKMDPFGATSDDPFSFIQDSGVSTKSSNYHSKMDPTGTSSVRIDDSFSSFQSAYSTNISAKTDGLGEDPFEILRQSSSSRRAMAQPVDPDPLENFWSSSISSKPVPQVSTLPDEWGLESDFREDEGGVTTELEGLPPPSHGVTANIAKDKGLENYKQGQFADAIKWLSWATELTEKNGNELMLIDVLTFRASCFKEVGEYKKAVTDCSKVIELDESNTAVLLQRAILYESMEKYKLGVADLREVVKRDPHNKLATNTLSRLVKLVD